MININNIKGRLNQLISEKKAQETLRLSNQKQLKTGVPKGIIQGFSVIISEQKNNQLYTKQKADAVDLIKSHAKHQKHSINEKEITVGLAKLYIKPPKDEIELIKYLEDNTYNLANKADKRMFKLFLNSLHDGIHINQESNVVEVPENSKFKSLIDKIPENHKMAKEIARQHLRKRIEAFSTLNLIKKLELCPTYEDMMEGKDTLPEYLKRVVIVKKLTSIEYLEMLISEMKKLELFDFEPIYVAAVSNLEELQRRDAQFPEARKEVEISEDVNALKAKEEELEEMLEILHESKEDILEKLQKRQEVIQKETEIKNEKRLSNIKKSIEFVNAQIKKSQDQERELLTRSPQIDSNNRSYGRH